MKNVIILIFFLLLSYCCIGCEANSSDEICYAFGQNYNVVMVDQCPVIQKNGLLYMYNQKKNAWNPLCKKNNCPHRSLTEDESSGCPAAVDPGCVIGCNGSVIYTAAYNGSTLHIKMKEPYKEDYKVIKEVSDFTWRAFNGASFNGVFDSNYFYYTYFQPGSLDILPIIELRRISLKGDSDETDILYSFHPQGGMPSVQDTHIYDDHITVLFQLSEPDESRFYYGIYSFEDDQWTEYPVSSSLPLAYCPGKIIYMNDSSGIEIYDIKENVVCSSFVPENFDSQSTLFCDKQYIYISHNEESLKGNSAESLNVDVYEYSGKYVGSISVPDSDQNGQRTGACLFSTDRYLFVGYPYGGLESVPYGFLKSTVISGYKKSG